MKNKLLLTLLILVIVLISGCNSFNSCLEKCARVNNCTTKDRINYDVKFCEGEIQASEINRLCFDECKGS